MFSNNPIYALIPGIIYILMIYLFVRREKKNIKYGITILFSLLYLVFLFFWSKTTDFLMTSSNVEFSIYNDFFAFVNISYFVLGVPFLVIIAWYGIKKILAQNQFLWLKRLFVLVYGIALVGILLLGQPIFIILYYGFAP